VGDRGKRMNWETYKTLTPEQKEEYRFRFRDNKPIIDASRVISWTVVLVMTSYYLLFLSYIFMIGEHFEPYRDQVEDMLFAGFKIYQSVGIFIMIVLFYQSMRLLIFVFLERRWCKRNNIKNVWGWPFKKWGKKSDQTF
jgi:hypothetical protein